MSAVRDAFTGGLRDAVRDARAKPPTGTALGLALLPPWVVLLVAHEIDAPFGSAPGFARSMLFVGAVLWAARVGERYARRVAQSEAALRVAGANCISCGWHVDRVTVEEAGRAAKEHVCPGGPS